MAKYTLELRTIIDDPYAPYLFNFDYEFYDNDLKSIFENKFMEYYYFDEIGFPTIQRFKHNLKSKLNMIMPYYKKLYETEIASKDINFLLNKALKETFIREVELNSSLENVTNTFGTNEGNSLGYKTDSEETMPMGRWKDVFAVRYHILFKSTDVDMIVNSVGMVMNADAKTPENLFSKHTFPWMYLKADRGYSLEIIWTFDIM